MNAETFTESGTSPTKKPLIIKASCASCGLIAEATKPSTNPITGETEYACKYLIDPLIKEQVSIVEQRCDVPALRNGDGQIKLVGLTGVFCSVFCTMQGLLTYGRCAGCAKTLPRKKLLRDWHTVKDGEGVSQYGVFDYCSPECKQAYSDRTVIWSAHHMLQMLSKFGAKVTLPAAPRVDISDFKGRCAYLVCGGGRDARGNRVRARVPKRGDYCSAACRKADKEVTLRQQAAEQASEGV